MQLPKEHVASLDHQEDDTPLEYMDIYTERHVNQQKRLYNPDGSLLVGDEEYRRETKRRKF